MNPIIDQFGTKRWYNNNLLHRDNDLPAVITANGTRKWYINGERHRLYKPAIIYPDRSHYWYINDIDVTKEVNNFIKEYDLPEWSNWSDENRILFRMRF